MRGENVAHGKSAVPHEAMRYCGVVLAYLQVMRCETRRIHWERHKK